MALNFDGILHAHTSWDLDERGYQSLQAAVSRPYAKTLQEAYVYVRTHARHLGVRTFPPDLPYIESLVMQNLTTFRTAVPDHATHLFADVRYTVPSAVLAGATGMHDIYLTGSPDITTDPYQGRGVLGDDDSTQRALITYPLVQDDLDASSIDRDDMVVAVRGYGTNGAEGASERSVRYRPFSVTLYWTSQT